jgi:hypothetical protein
MKYARRAAVVLAAVAWPSICAATGWYLMLPPTPQLAAPGPVSKQWLNVKAFDSADVCERARDTAIQRWDAEVELFGKDPKLSPDLRRAIDEFQARSSSDDKALERFTAVLGKEPLFQAMQGQQAARAAVCVSSDDPRLR